MLAGMLGKSASLTRPSISPGEEEGLWAASRSMPPGGGHNQGCRHPLPVASPPRSPSRPSERRWGES